MKEFFKRLFFDDFVISGIETAKLDVYIDKKYHHWMIKRKTQLAMLLALTSLRAILMNIELIMNSIDAFHEYLNIFTTNTLISLMIIKILLVLFEIAKIAMLIWALYYWYDFDKSTSYIHVCGVITFYFQLVFLFMPYIDMINFVDDNLVTTTAKYITLFGILKYVYSILITNAFIIQSILGISRNIQHQFPEYKAISAVKNSLLAAYIPLVAFIFSLGFQITYTLHDLYSGWLVLPSGMQYAHFIILFWLLYTSSLLIDFITKWRNILNAILNISLLIMIIYITSHIGYNIWQNLLTIYLGQLLTNIIISDFLIVQSGIVLNCEEVQLTEVSAPL